MKNSEVVRTVHYSPNSGQQYLEDEFIRAINELLPKRVQPPTFTMDLISMEVLLNPEERTTTFGKLILDQFGAELVWDYGAPDYIQKKRPKLWRFNTLSLEMQGFIKACGCVLAMYVISYYHEDMSLMYSSLF